MLMATLVRLARRVLMVLQVQPGQLDQQEQAGQLDRLEGRLAQREIVGLPVRQVVPDLLGLLGQLGRMVHLVRLARRVI